MLRRPLPDDLPRLTSPTSTRSPSMLLSSPQQVGNSLSLLSTLYTVRMDFCLKVCMAVIVLDAPSGL